MIPNDIPMALNTSSCKMKFASRFLRALSKMRKPRSLRKRSQRIKMAAYSSMAHAVGPRRAWSRAILMKLGSRARQHHHHMLMRRKRSSSWLGKNKRVIRNRRCPASPSAPPEAEADQLSQANKLRKLVPGGKSMDMCSLLEETAHFVRCLNAQIKIMKTIAGHYSK